jgi:hypothetical protein
MLAVRLTHPAPASHGVTLGCIVHAGRYRSLWLIAVTMPGDLAETRRRESHQTWEASS